MLSLPRARNGSASFSRKELLMGHAEFSRYLIETNVVAAPSSPATSLYGARSEPLALPASAEFADPCAVNWESAWIDLGGEG